MNEDMMSMEQLETIKKNFTARIKLAKDVAALELAHREFLGRRGQLREIFQSLGELDDVERKKVAGAANALKDELTEAYDARLDKLGGTNNASGIVNDVTLPGIAAPVGHMHLVSRMINDVTSIFARMGFDIAEGPDIETAHYNFDTLNIPKNHPARDLWDTFWMQKDADGNDTDTNSDNGRLLRTHTSPGQVRYMERKKPPFRMVIPGRCFRFENADRTHGFEFHQIEGMMVGPNISAAHFKGILSAFFTELFESDERIEIRLRPSYFPFTEPSFEVFIWFEGEWLEVMGAGMVHPNVYRGAGYDEELIGGSGESPGIQGFAFGGGIERLIMIKHGITDLRTLYNGDLRIIRQF